VAFSSGYLWQQMARHARPPAEAVFPLVSLVKPLVTSASGTALSGSEQ
jgi:hypothetical protein